MPFRDPVSFLVLPPGVTPPVVGTPVILLDPGPPFPTIKFYTGDADEDSPADLSTLVFPDGSLIFNLAGPIHTGSGSQASISISSGSDAAPSQTSIFLDAFAVELEGVITLDGDTNVLGHDLTVRSNPVPSRLGQDVDTASSGTITTTETIVQTVTVSVVSGQTYRITADIGLAVSIPGDAFMIRIREDNASGTVLQARRPIHPTTSSPYPFHEEAEFTAGSTGSKTFVLTMQRTAGTGNIVLAASGTQPSFFYVDYVRG